MNWQKTLHLRLTAQYDRLARRKKTKQTEDTLGWSHHAYFFVGRPHPDYGTSVTLFDHPLDGAAPWAVAPFDTGGLVHGKIATRTNLSEEERRDLIEHWSRSDTTYTIEFEGWVEDAFDDADGYVIGMEPSTHLVPQIDPTANDDYSWTWEGRLSALGYESRPMEPTAVILSDGRQKQFYEWLRAERVIPLEELAEYMSWVGGLITEEANPVAAAQDILCVGRASE
ncbi:hypothetical protein [Microbacterium sp. NPDC089696]|uniref:hypothetical protein n=1 Tax=Microbacterium sp. NPDC089696 TaxID=3364199 RepID=UPI00380EAE53